MVIYNVTIKVENGIQEGWLRWLIEEHIPELVRTGCFSHAVILRMLEPDDGEGITYAVQYHARSKEDYNRYIQEHAASMQQKAKEKWGDRFVAFRTVMEVVH